jgi:hypothetical protein
MNNDVLLINNTPVQDTVLVPVTAVQADLVTQTDTIVYVPLASRTAPGIVQIGSGLLISGNGLLEFDRSEVTIKKILKNGKELEIVDKTVNITMDKHDVGLSNVDNTADKDKEISDKAMAKFNALEESLSKATSDVNSDLQKHKNNTNNPHSVTKAQVGLGNVDNTTDLNKPISRAVQRELNRLDTMIKGATNTTSYNSYEEMVSDVLTLSNTSYFVGQSVYILTKGVPDIWIFKIEDTFVDYKYTTDDALIEQMSNEGFVQIGYYCFAMLETLKVNLTNYVTLDGNQVITGDINFTGVLQQNGKDVALKEDLEPKADTTYVDEQIALVNETITTEVQSLNDAKADRTELPTDYIKSASISDNALTLTKQDDTTLEFIGEPNSYIKSASVSGNALTLTKQDDTTLEFVGEPSEYIKSLSVTGTTLTLTDKSGNATSFKGGVYKGTCDTRSTSSTKIVTCPDFVLEKGAIIDVTFTYSNGGVSSLNVNNTGAAEIYYYEIGLKSELNLTTRLGADDSVPYGGWAAGDTVRFFYDGHNWIEQMNMTQGIPYSIPYQATYAYKSRTQTATDNSTNIATTAFVHTAIDAALEAGTGSEDIYLPLAGGQMTGQLKLDSSGILFPNVYRLSGEGIMPNANTSQFKMYKPGDAFTKGLVYNYETGITEREGAILFSSNATYSTTSQPTALSYGRLQSYGTLNINANTDNSGTEYVNITAGHGCSSSTADGLSIGTDTLTWKDQPVIHSGNISSYAVAGATSNYISSKYMRFCQLQTNVGSSFSFATFLITAGGDFGGRFVGTYLVTIGTRGGTDGSIKVLCLQKPSTPGGFKFGYRTNPDNSNRVDYFMYGATYNFYPINVVCLTKGGNYTVNTDLVEISAPSSYTTASYNGDMECNDLKINGTLTI